MFVNINNYFEDEKYCVKYVRYYELALFLKSNASNHNKKLYYYDSILEFILNQNNLIEDYYNEDEDCWYPGYYTPRTADLVKGLLRMYYKGGAKKILVKIPISLLPILEEVKTRPKYRWRSVGKAKKMTIPWL